MARNLKVGDVVKLKSGGPEMTVKSTFSNVNSDPMVNCIWFHDGKIEEFAFDPALLDEEDD